APDAVLLALAKLTVARLVPGALRLTGRSTYPSASPTITSGGAEMRGEETAVAPLAPMTTTPLLSTTVALVGKLNVTVKLLEGTEPVRFVIATAMFSAVWPGPNVRVPLVAV